MAKNDTKTFTVEQYASQIRRPGKQTQVLTGLGLKRIGDRRTLKDTPKPAAWSPPSRTSCAWSKPERRGL